MTILQGLYNSFAFTTQMPTHVYIGPSLHSVSVALLSKSWIHI